jgi:putative RNA 2'-phosphotransferase
MKSENYYQRLSKTMSYILRHSPEKFGISLDEKGSTDVQTLLSAIQSSNQFSKTTLADILHVVDTDEKGRYSVADGRIWANQGHSINVDVPMSKKTPPNVLYHGTSTNNLNNILRYGLSKMRRNHVHLSFDIDTAVKVGSRHGVPVVLKVDTSSMSYDGHIFFLSENGVWLTDNVPPDYLEVHESKDHGSTKP